MILMVSQPGLGSGLVPDGIKPLHTCKLQPYFWGVSDLREISQNIMALPSVNYILDDAGSYDGDEWTQIARFMWPNGAHLGPGGPR